MTLPGVSWAGLKAGARGSSKDSLTHMSAGQCWLPAKNLAGLFAGTLTCFAQPFLSMFSGLPCNMAAAF